ncbi:MAG: hypothetical protein PVH18_02350 [Chloroflexota bacterium]|jgi:hypothetical protein
MSRGEALRSHRDIEGNKYFRLHQPDGDWREVNANDVHALRAARLIDSNKKFPVATFWLTEGGREYASHRP